MKLNYGIGMILLLCIVCINSNAQFTEDQIKDEAIIHLYKSKCFRDLCPSYNLYLMPNGKLILDAVSNIEKEGRYCLYLTEDEYQKIELAFIEADFFSFEDEYIGNIPNMNRFSGL